MGYKKYKLNESYFDSMDTEEKAYILGFIYTDGYNSIKLHRLSISLKDDLSENKLLNKINVCLNSNYPIKHYSRIRKNYINAKIREEKTVTLMYHNKQLSWRLCCLGCTQRKTYDLKMPLDDINSNLYRHLLRGIMDGDGTYYISNKFIKNMSGKKRIKMKLVSASKIFIDQCSEIIHKELNIKCKIIQINPKFRPNHYIQQKVPLYRLRLERQNDVKKVIDWLYKDATIFLQRKYEKAMLISNIINN